MLVYANNFELTGNNPALQVLRALSRWFTEKLGEPVAIREVTYPGERSGGSPHCWLRTDSAEGEGFKIYSWVLKHPDSSVTGRQWVTELGLKENENNSADFSCVVYTEEQSTIVSDPVQASRPRIVKFIFENVNHEALVNFSVDTIGSTVKSVGESAESYKALLSEIERPERKFPIVIVSPSNDGTYPVDPAKLQKTLFGLAQVIGINEDFNSYEMEEVLGRNYSAWAGAINIVRVPHRNGQIFNYLIQEKDIPSILDTQYKRECFVLGRVSHNTNIPLQRSRIRPDGVKALAAQNRIKSRVAKMLEVDHGQEVKEELQMVYEELTTLSEQLEGAQQAKESVELTLVEMEDKVQDLEKQLRTKQFYTQDRSYSDAAQVIESTPLDLLRIASTSSEPTPEECLAVLQAVFSDKVIVLDSAIESSREASGFQQGRRLLDMLRRLILEYLPKYLSEGDKAARNCFTNNEFSARESDTVTSNKDIMRYRIFNVIGVDTEMAKHLKIGIADDPARTIRVHFEVLQKDKKIVLGHCGKHLPLPGH